MADGKLQDFAPDVQLFAFAVQREIALGISPEKEISETTCNANRRSPPHFLLFHPQFLYRVVSRVRTKLHHWMNFNAFRRSTLSIYLLRLTTDSTEHLPLHESRCLEFIFGRRHSFQQGARRKTRSPFNI